MQNHSGTRCDCWALQSGPGLWGICQEPERGARTLTEPARTAKSSHFHFPFLPVLDGFFFIFILIMHMHGYRTCLLKLLKYLLPSYIHPSQKRTQPCISKSRDLQFVRTWLSNITCQLNLVSQTSLLGPNRGKNRAAIPQQGHCNYNALGSRIWMQSLLNLGVCHGPISAEAQSIRRKKNISWEIMRKEWVKNLVSVSNWHYT